jgi:hypothetical protein
VDLAAARGYFDEASALADAALDKWFASDAMLRRCPTA